MDFGASRAHTLARELLLMQKPARLPIRVERLRFDKSLIIDSLENYCALTGDTLRGLCADSRAALQDGCTLIRRRGTQNIYIVLYNQSARSIRRRNFTLAHEVGHIYLGHEQDGPAWERQANAFASELLMPRILAAQYLKTPGGCLDPAVSLAQAFDVSLSMARLRMSGLAQVDYTAQEKKLLARYKAALPHPDEPEIAY